MDSIFLATVIGWYMVIFSLLVLFKQEYVKSASTDIMANHGQFFIVALITLILGLLLVASHNVWIMAWPVVITIFGWMLLVGGIIRLFFPESMHRIWASLIGKPMIFNVVAVVILIVGLYLLFHVYPFHF